MGWCHQNINTVNKLQVFQIRSVKCSSAAVTERSWTSVYACPHRSMNLPACRSWAFQLRVLNICLLPLFFWTLQIIFFFCCNGNIKVYSNRSTGIFLLHSFLIALHHKHTNLLQIKTNSSKVYRFIDSICLSFSMALQPFGPWPLFQFLNLYTVGRTHWTRYQPVGRPLPTHRINAHRQPCLGWDSTKDPSVRAG
jgi:hypothetical protein